MYLRKGSAKQIHSIGYRALGLTMLCSGLLLNPISQAMASEFSTDGLCCLIQREGMPAPLCLILNRYTVFQAYQAL